MPGELTQAIEQFRASREPFRQVFAGWMIDYEETGTAGVSGEPGFVYVLLDRGEGLATGDVIKARARIRPVPGWGVFVGETRQRPWEYEVLDVDLSAMGGGAVPGGGGIDGEAIVEYHHEMHEWGNPSGSDDVVYPRFLQLYDFAVWPGLGVQVCINGGIYEPTGDVLELLYQCISLTGELPPEGERWVLICLSPTGTFELVPGVYDGFVDLLDIPDAPSDDHWELAAVKLSYDTTQIIHTPANPSIIDLRFSKLGWPQQGAGGIISHHDLSDLTDGDDHTQYILVDGTRAFSAYVDMTEIAPPATPGADILRLFVEDVHGFSFFKFIDATGMTRAIVRDSVIVVRNERGSTIAAGRIVYAAGSTGDVPLVDTAQADDLATMPAIGVTIEAIANNSYGRVMQVGLLENVNTSGFAAGDVLYVSAATPGVPTATPPTYPNVRQEIGTVLVSDAAVGSIQIVARSILNEAIIDHGGLLGLADDDHTQYALLAGRAGGQTLYGGTGAGDDLTLYSTSHATKGQISLADVAKVDEANGWMVVGDISESPAGWGTYFAVLDNTLDITTHFTGILVDLKKTAGVTNYADDFIAVSAFSEVDHTGTQIGDVIGVWTTALLTDGTVGGVGNEAQIIGAKAWSGAQSGTTVNGDLIAADFATVASTTTITGDVKGINFLGAILTSVIGGSSYVFYSNTADTFDYFIWSDDALPSYFGGPIHVLGEYTADPVAIGIYDLTYSATDSVIALLSSIAKTGGVTDAADHMYGIATDFQLNQSGGVIGNIYGGRLEANLVLGTMESMYGAYIYANVDAGTVNVSAHGVRADLEQDGGTISTSGFGGRFLVNLDAGEITTTVFGAHIQVDQEATHTIGGNVYTLYVNADLDGTVTGTAYLAYFAESTGLDWGLYYSGSANHYLGTGTVGIGTADLEAWHASYTSSIEFYRSAIFAANNSELIAFVSNAYYDGAWKRKSVTNDNAYLRVYDGTYEFRRADAGAADSAITWEIPMLITAAGTVEVSKDYTTTPAVNSTLIVWNDDIGSTTHYYGIYNSHEAVGVATNYVDTHYGLYSIYHYNDPGGEIGNLYGIRAELRQSDGTIGNAVSGVRSAFGAYFRTDLDGGTVTGDAFGLSVNVDQEAGHTVTDDIWGVYIYVDADGTNDSVRMLQLVPVSNVDYGIYQGGTVTTNYFASPVSVGTTSVTGIVTIDQSSTTAAVPVIVLDQADISEGTINFIASARGVITGATNSADSVRVELNGTVYRLALYADA